MKRHNPEALRAALPKLVEKLRDLKGQLSPGQQEVFSEMIKLAATQARELQAEQLATVTAAGSGIDSLFSKAQSSHGSLGELATIADLGVESIGIDSLFSKTQSSHGSLGELATIADIIVK